MQRFNVTFELITEESAEVGEAEETGFIAHDVGLREGLDLVRQTETNQCEQTGIEANESPIRAPRWITVYNSPDRKDGITENRSLHIPEHVTDASRRRICRLFGLKVGG